MDKTQKTIISEVEIVIVNRPITDNIGEPLQTINLTSHDQSFTKEQFEKALKKVAHPVTSGGEKE